MRMKEAGLLDIWWKQFSVDSSYCLRKIDKETNNKKSGDNKKPLTIQGLSGAFLILGVGSSIAIAVFIVGICHSRINNEHQLMSSINSSDDEICYALFKKIKIYFKIKSKIASAIKIEIGAKNASN